MARINNEDINRVRQSANITEVIGQYLSIEKKGRNFVALCPFHEDNNPSMSISEDKQIYKCFVCGAGGNVFTFVSKFSNVSFVAAVKVVADFVNIPLDISEYTSERKIDDNLVPLYKMMDDALDFMHFKLMNSQEKLINDYVKNRGLTNKEMEYFDVGYESDNSLADFLPKKGYDITDLVSVNLLNDYDYGLRSVFNNRLVFPIHNQYKNTVGFSARAIIDDSNIPKYINSNENIIYTKGDILYNYHRAYETAKKENKIYLVEGVMDAIAYYQGDVLNVVASLGTALTNKQAELLKSMANHVIISYDGDSAGQMATVKAINTLIKHRFTIEVLDGFSDLDPDDYIKKYGKDKFNEALEEKVGYLDYLIRYFKVKYNLDNFEERKEFTVTLLKYMSSINSDFDKEYFINQIANLTKFTQSQIAKLVTPEGIKPQVVAPQRKISGITSKRAEYNLIGQMLSGKEAAIYIRNEIGFLPDPQLAGIYLIINDYYFKNDELNEADLISYVDQSDNNLSDLFLSILNNDTIIKEYSKDIIDENIDLIKVRLIDEEIKQLRLEVVDGVNEQVEILNKITELYLQRSEILRK